MGAKPPFVQKNDKEMENNSLSTNKPHEIIEEEEEKGYGNEKNPLPSTNGFVSRIKKFKEEARNIWERNPEVEEEKLREIEQEKRSKQIMKTLEENENDILLKISEIEKKIDNIRQCVKGGSLRGDNPTLKQKVSQLVREKMILEKELEGVRIRKKNHQKTKKMCEKSRVQKLTNEYDKDVLLDLNGEVNQIVNDAIKIQKVRQKTDQKLNQLDELYEMFAEEEEEEFDLLDEQIQNEISEVLSGEQNDDYNIEKILNQKHNEEQISDDILKNILKGEEEEEEERNEDNSFEATDEDFWNSITPIVSEKSFGIQKVSNVNIDEYNYPIIEN